MSPSRGMSGAVGASAGNQLTGKQCGIRKQTALPAELFDSVLRLLHEIRFEGSSRGTSQATPFAQVWLVAAAGPRWRFQEAMPRSACTP